MTPLADPILAATLWTRFWSPAVPIYRHALLAGAAIALLCGVLSVFVVSKRMAFIGQGISHSAFGGAGLALFLGLYIPWLRSPLGRDLVIAVFCITVAVAIGRMAWRERVSEDSAIGIALVGAMALGVILLDLRMEKASTLVAAGRLDIQGLAAPKFEDILFGNLLALTRQEVWMAWGVALVSLAAVALFYKELVFYAFDSEGAAVFGVPATAVHYGLLVILAVTIVVAMRMMGVVLAAAFLVLPATIAMLWSRRMCRVMLLSVAFAVTSLVPGLVIAMHLNFTVGPVIVMVLCLALAASYGAKALGRQTA